MASSKKGISAHQLHRTLEITYKSAWFLAHRIREAIEVLLVLEVFGGEDKIVEADETFIGNEREKPAGARVALEKCNKEMAHKNKILSLVERDGRVKSFHISAVNVGTIKPILKANIHPETAVITDEATWYKKLKNDFATHEYVRHSNDEYVKFVEIAKKDGQKTTLKVHTNTIEGYFGLFKRGSSGIYQHCKSQHLGRYLCEFDYRYNSRKEDDRTRARGILSGAVGKRLKYTDEIIAAV